MVKLKEKQINLAETIGIDDAEDEVDSGNGPIICLDDTPDFSKMIRKQGVAGQIEESKLAKKGYDPSSMMSLEKLSNLDLR